MAEIDKPRVPNETKRNESHENAEDQSNRKTESNSGPEMAGPTHGEAAADAAAFLERGGGSLEGLGSTAEEIDRQAACLIVWARQRKLLLSSEYIAGLFKHRSVTAEHEVYYRAADNRAVKCTYAGTFGVTPEPRGVQRAAAPLFYLRRLELMNHVFKSGLRLEGIMLGMSLLIGSKGDRPSIVVSQPWIRPSDPSNPHPPDGEIAKFMESLGFNQISASYFGWQRPADAITILDARRDNFIKSDEGIVPIDLVISQLKP